MGVDISFWSIESFWRCDWLWSRMAFLGEIWKDDSPQWHLQLPFIWDTVDASKNSAPIEVGSKKNPCFATGLKNIGIHLIASGSSLPLPFLEVSPCCTTYLCRKNERMLINSATNVKHQHLRKSRPWFSSRVLIFGGWDGWDTFADMENIWSQHYQSILLVRGWFRWFPIMFIFANHDTWMSQEVSKWFNY